MKNSTGVKTYPFYNFHLIREDEDDNKFVDCAIEANVFAMNHHQNILYFCPMDSQRQLKVSKMLQRELGDMFQREGKSKYGGAMITVTKVTVTKDLSIARVFLSLFATKDKQALLETIRMNAGETRYNLGRRIKNQVRHIPELEFFEDDSLDYIEKIEDLLDK